MFSRAHACSECLQTLMWHALPCTVVFARAHRYIGHISDTEFFRHGTKSARRQTGHARGALAAEGSRQAVPPASSPGLERNVPRLAGRSGPWGKRLYDVITKSHAYETWRGVVADDYADADGETVLSFGQAVRRVLDDRPRQRAGRRWRTFLSGTSRTWPTGQTHRLCEVPRRRADIAAARQSRGRNVSHRGLPRVAFGFGVVSLQTANAGGRDGSAAISSGDRQSGVGRHISARA